MRFSRDGRRMGNRVRGAKLFAQADEPRYETPSFVDPMRETKREVMACATMSELMRCTISLLPHYWARCAHGWIAHGGTYSQARPPKPDPDVVAQGPFDW